MQLRRGELEALLGMSIPPDGPFVANYVSGDGDRRAFIGMDVGGRLQAEVTDHVTHDPESVLSFVADYDREQDGFVLVGEDLSGEGSDSMDPRCALSSFRRMTRVMEFVA